MWTGYTWLSVSIPLHNTEIKQINNKLCNHDIIINKIYLRHRSQIQIAINHKANIQIKQAINEFTKSCQIQLFTFKCLRLAKFYEHFDRYLRCIKSVNCTKYNKCNNV